MGFAVGAPLLGAVVGVRVGAAVLGDSDGELVGAETVGDSVFQTHVWLTTSQAGSQ